MNSTLPNTRLGSPQPKIPPLPANRGAVHQYNRKIQSGLQTNHFFNQNTILIPIVDDFTLCNDSAIDHHRGAMTSSRQQGAPRFGLQAQDFHNFPVGVTYENLCVNGNLEQFGKIMYRLRIPVGKTRIGYFLPPFRSPSQVFGLTAAHFTFNRMNAQQRAGAQREKID